jgi:hypothetical protein
VYVIWGQVHGVARTVPVFGIRDYCVYYFCIKELEDVAKALASKTNEIAVKYRRYMNGNAVHGQAKISLN